MRVIPCIARVSLINISKIYQKFMINHEINKTKEFDRVVFVLSQILLMSALFNRFYVTGSVLPRRTGVQSQYLSPQGNT